MLQVSDAPPYTGRDWWDETMNGRLLPGDGVFDLHGLLRVVRDGKGNPPIGVEIYSEQMRSLAPAEAGRAAGNATRAVLATLD